MVHAPELFGDGAMYLLQTRGYILGYIDAWGGWAIYGRASACRIVQIMGTPIDGAEQSIPCFMNFQKDHRFSGWIDFRGHRRKFCGASNLDSIPLKCYRELR